MILQIFIAVLLGILAGTFTGLIPGIHVNLVSASVVALFYGSSLNPLLIAAFIVAMAVTHSFLDSIPSIFLGAPDADQAMGVLPGHKMLLAGRGILAVKLTLAGSVLSLLLSLALSPLFFLLLKYGYVYIRPFIPFALIAIALWLILRDSKPFFAFFVFVSTGVLGYLVFQAPIRNSLFPLLTGLFGIATLLLSLKTKPKIPPQDSVGMHASTTKPGIVAALTGGLTGVLPGIGSAAAAGLASVAWKRITPESFLVLVGGINTANFMMSIWSLYVLEKARNGAVIAVQSILERVSFSHVLLFIGVGLVAGGLAFFLALKLTLLFAKIVPRIPYSLLVSSIIVFLVGMTFVLSGWLGFVILATSASLGMIAPLAGCARVHGMGCILIPVVIFLLV
ncbi:MAG: tripartite tricarboxylate transporter permease [Candidatus Woesearchaeota archaeon]